MCMIVRNCTKAAYVEGWSFEKTLQSIRARFPDAELVIVDTQSSDATPEIAQRYADVFDSYKGPRGDWNTEMHAFDDAAAARKRSFELATGKWIGWIDADDEIPDAAETERLLKLNGRWKVSAPGQTEVDVAEEARYDGPMWIEETLAFIQRQFPKVECLICPYLYHSDANGLALGDRNGWQERERFIKRREDGSLPWVWREEGHEIMVPLRVEDFAGMHYAPAWLWVHKKLWTEGEQRFTLERHFKVIYNKYLAGDRTTRNLIYLSTFSSVMPEHAAMREKFIHEAVEYATTPVDLLRAHIEVGNYAAQRGLYNDAKAAFAAAVTFKSELPDGWLAGAEAALQFEDYGWAVDYFRRSMKCHANIESQINPRNHALATPAKLAKSLYKIAENQTALGLHDNALAFLEEARQLIDAMAVHPAVGPDKQEARGYQAEAHSKADSQRCMITAFTNWQFLVRNDETEKALKLIDTLPNTLEDHPLKIEMEHWAVKMKRHFADEKAYFDFYATSTGADHNGSPEIAFEAPMGRARYAIDWITANQKRVDVLEIGSFDGVIGIPVLDACENVSRYTAIDASERALDMFVDRAKRKGTASRLTTVHAAAHCNWPVQGYFDVVICYEMIEHVPDPVALVRALLDRVRNGGRLFLSTPWLSFDKSLPAELEKRDPRGHVRAMTLRDMARVVEEAGGEIEDGYNYRGGFGGIGDTMHVRVKRSVKPCLTCDDSTDWTDRPVTFAVAGALWPWNSRLVHDTGMGASEETIVYLARELAKSRPVEVYGPVNEPEVHHGVAYWPLSQLHRARPGSDLVVSRAPSFLRQLEQRGLTERFRKKILWLQDVGYPDLNPKVGDEYDHTIVLTKWHADCIETMNGVPAEQLDIIGNFLLPEHFTSKIGTVKDGVFESSNVTRKPWHFVYASSPDRGLIPLLEMWPEILNEYPHATLDIFYGWEGCKKLSVGNPAWTGRFQQIRRRYDELRHQKGVSERGRINHVQLGVELRTAAVWYYPCHDFWEAGCLTAIKARAAGAIPVVPPIAALPETAASALTQWLPSEERWKVLGKEAKTERTMEAIHTAIAMLEGPRKMMAAEAIKHHSLEVELPKWLELLK